MPSTNARARSRKLRFRCSHCERKFQQARDRDRHEEINYADALRPAQPFEGGWFCQVVGCKRNVLSFKRRDRLLNHMKSVHRDEPAEEAGPEEGEAAARNSAVQQNIEAEEESGLDDSGLDDSESTAGGDSDANGEDRVDASAEGRSARRAQRRNMTASGGKDKWLEKLPREALLEHLIRIKRKYGKLKEEREAERKQNESRQEMMLKVVASQLEVMRTTLL